MPVSHIGLTVSHLPTSCSFFLSALQPLGYRFIGQQGNQIGLGIHDADFFLCQETPGMKAGAAHIAFTARSRTAVRDFYANALNAGGRPNGSPSERNAENGYFNAAVLDFDGNSIEVVYRNEPDLRDDGTVIEHSRVLTWQREVSESVRDDRSVASSIRTTRSTSKPLALPAPSIAPSKASTKAQSVAQAPSVVRSVSAPVAPVAPAQSTTSSIGDGAAKKIIGTLLGAAAGAAVAYAMVKSEEDSAKKEAEYNASVQARSQAPAQTQALPAPSQSQPKLSLQDPQPIYESPPRTVHRNISDTDSSYSTPLRGQFPPKAIEAGPARSYYSSTHISVPPTEIPQRKAIEYVPPTASTVLPTRSQFSAHRSVSSPESVYTLKSRSHVPPAPSTLISSFVPDEPTRPSQERRSSAGSIHSHHSSKSKAKSTHSHVSKHSSTSRHSSKSRSRGASPPSSKPGSIVGSILGRDASIHNEPDLIEELEIEQLNDTDTVVPSDSISNAGSSRRSHHSHRSSSGKSRSGGSTHSSSSKHSKRSHRSESRSHHSSSSKKSYHSSRSQRQDSSDPEFVDADEEILARSAVVSEPSDASTVKPGKRSSRKDSMFGSPAYAYGGGTVVSLPVRGITPSMIEETRGEKKGKRSVASYAMGQS